MEGREPCESCGTYVVANPWIPMGTTDDGGAVMVRSLRPTFVEVPFGDGRTQRMPVHTPERCQEARRTP